MTRTVKLSTLMDSSGVGFGTSGARGLVRAMTDEVCYAFTRAFLQSLEDGGGLGAPTAVGVAGDLRSSTGRIMTAVTRACVDHGHRPINCGRIPSPAAALLGLDKRIPTVMVTGSHIPDDRNGIKFNKASGEILKADEAIIKRQTVTLPDHFDQNGMILPGAVPAVPSVSDEARSAYVRRFLSAFPAAMLRGKRIVVYEHSSVARDILVEILGGLGADVLRVGASEAFIPVDTEAIRPADVDAAQRWAGEHQPFAIVSTDGDADRPLIGDEHGRWLRGDVAGILCAKYAGADVVVTPVSCNTAVEKCGLFDRVVRTKIGSPFVIEQMLRAVEAGGKCVVGYEANGGFLTASPVRLRQGSLSPLPTRDAVVVILSILGLAVDGGVSVSSLLEGLPSRFTASDRLTDFPTDRSAALLSEMTRKGPVDLEAALGKAVAVDVTDGLRVTFDSGEIAHLRASGNAPELRCYAEASTEKRAREITSVVLDLARTRCHC
jgi:phosphomannomutase